MFRRCSTLHYCLSSTPHHCLSSTLHRCISISPEAREVSSLPTPLLHTATPCLCSQPPRVPVVSTPSLVSSEFTYYILSQKLNPNSCLLHFSSVHSTATTSSLHYRRVRRLSITLASPSHRHTCIAVAPSHSHRRCAVTLASPSFCPSVSLSQLHSSTLKPPMMIDLKLINFRIQCHLSNFTNEPQLSSTSHCCIMKRLFC
ncbi:hypothetical protein S83_033758 [Arachis hypogaea]